MVLRLRAKVRFEELITGDPVACFGVRNRADDQGRMLAVCRVMPRPYLDGDIVGDGFVLSHGCTSEQYRAREWAAHEARADI